MEYAQPRIRPRKSVAKILWDFQIQTDPVILARQPDLVIVKNKTKATSRIDDFVVPAENGVKLKESKKRNKYLDLAKELKKL